MTLFNDDNFDQTEGEKPAPGEAFVMVPAIFTAHLTPEQFRAEQQIYQVAYEKARQQLEEDSSGGEFSFDI